MQFVANVAIPLLVVVAMTIVGLELTPSDFRRALHFPAAVATVILGQLVLLPAIAWGVAQLLQAQAQLAAGLILIAAAPIAASANYYALLARADVALSVTLTAVSNVVALVATPLVVSSAFAWLLQHETSIHLPIVPAARQLLLALLLPIALGMLIRRMAPDWTQRHRQTLQRLSLLALGAIIVFVLTDQAAAIAQGLVPLVMATLLFTAISAGAGFTLAATLWRASGARTAVTLGFCDRNLSAAMMLAATVLGRMDFVAFSAAFFVIQAALLLPVLLWLRRQGSVAATPT